MRMFLERHPDWLHPTSTTTRAPRQGEISGKDMNFVSHEEFEKRQKAGEFLETDFHASHWYGTLREPVETALSEGKSVLLRIDVNGALQIKSQMSEAVLIFINAENEAALEARIRVRKTETEKQIQERLALAKRELTKIKDFDHVVINATGKQKEALSRIETILEV